MSGMEKILEHIQETARGQADAVLRTAQAQADAILSEAETACEKTREDGAAAAKAYLEAEAEKSERVGEMQQKRAVLAAKGEAVGAVLERAKKELLEQDDESYFAFLYALLAKMAEPAEGTLSLSEKDLARRPSDFENRIAAISAEKGGRLTLAEEPAAIEGGFILSYGGTVENGSVDALFQAEEDQLKDMVCRILFAGDTEA